MPQTQTGRRRRPRQQRPGHPDDGGPAIEALATEARTSGRADGRSLNGKLAHRVNDCLIECVMRADREPGAILRLRRLSARTMRLRGQYALLPGRLSQKPLFTCSFISGQPGVRFYAPSGRQRMSVAVGGPDRWYTQFVHSTQRPRT